jgi:hypothetical protein
MLTPTVAECEQLLTEIDRFLARQVRRFDVAGYSIATVAAPLARSDGNDVSLSTRTPGGHGATSSANDGADASGDNTDGCDDDIDGKPGGGGHTTEHSQ